MSDVERTVMFQLPTVIAGKLVCVEGTVAGSSYDLTAGTFVIGRREGADLFLPDEAGVSKMHAKILAEGERYTIVDAESRNGTVVNGAPIQRHVLKDGDEIRICSCVLRFSQSGDIDVKNPVEAYQEQVNSADAVVPPVNATAQVVKAPAPTDRIVASVPQKKKGLFIPFVTGFMTFLLLGVAAMIVVVMLADDEASTLAKVEPPPSDVNPSDPKVGDTKASDPKVGDTKASDPKVGDDKATAKVGDAKATAKVGDAKVGDAKATDPNTGDAKAVDAKPVEPSKDPALASDTTPTFVAVERVAASPRVVRPRSGGRLQNFNVAVGDSVKASAPLFVTDTPVDRNAIATLRESINALAEVAESQPEAAEYLASEKAKLRSLEKKTRTVKTLAPVAGKVVSLNVKRGTRVSTKASVLTLQPLGETLKARFSKAVKRGAALTLQHEDGTNGSGEVISVEKSGSVYVATIVAARKNSPVTKAALKL